MSCQRRFWIELAPGYDRAGHRAANASWEKPQAWNIGATTTVISSARHGVRSSTAFSSLGPPPERLAPLALPVVPDGEQDEPAPAAGAFWPPTECVR